MNNITLPRLSAALRLLLCLCAVVCLASCSSDKPRKEEKKDNRTAEEKVLILKQRFAQLETSLDEMKNDLDIQKKRIESTRQLADSIRHSLTKGGLKGYNLDNVTTTDPLLLQSIAQQKEKNQEKKDREAARDASGDTLFNGFLIVVFLLIIATLFVLALKDKKTEENPLESVVMPNPNGDLTPPAETTPQEDATPGVDDTGSYRYGELRPRSQDRPEPEGEDRPL